MVQFFKKIYLYDAEKLYVLCTLLSHLACISDFLSLPTEADRILEVEPLSLDLLT